MSSPGKVAIILTLLIIPAASSAQCPTPHDTLTQELAVHDADRAAQRALELAARFVFDVDRCHLLSEALQWTRSTETAKSFFVAAAETASEDERAELLIAAARRGMIDARTESAFFSAANTFRSDVHRRRVLTAVLASHDVADVTLAQVLRTAIAMSSDAEFVSLLVEVARRFTLQGKVRELFLVASRSVDSVADYQRIAAALAATPYRAPTKR